MTRSHRRPDPLRAPRPRAEPPRRRGRFQHGPIPVIGLIGGIGAGKSAVAELLARRGAWVIDADKVGHALLDQRPARDEVVARFGSNLLETSPDSDQPPAINRALLGAIIFNDARARIDLERILHPRMRRTFEKAIARVTRQARSAAIVLDAAVLCEAGWANLCDLVLFVDADRATRLERLKRDRGWSPEELARRESAQFPLERKRGFADHTIANDGIMDSLDAAVEHFWSTCVKPPRNRQPQARSAVRPASSKEPSPRQESPSSPSGSIPVPPAAGGLGSPAQPPES